MLLHAVVQEDAYMHQPLGFEDPAHPTHVCKLYKAIYGLKQSPRAWYSRMSDRLQQLGFITSIADTSLFIFSHGSVTIYMLVHVDDIVIASSSDVVTDRLLHQLSATFPVKNLGQLRYFLGIEVAQNSRVIVLANRCTILICLSALT